jgi:CRISPR-associated protein Csm3
MEKLVKKIIIKGELEAITGLHIGGNKENVEIGGIDLPVIKRGIDNQPYIPGSSLKGKIRSLLQKAFGEQEMTQTGSLICALFGAIDGRDQHKGKLGNPSRILVRDCYFTKESSQELQESAFTDMPYVEVKFENTIDRVKGVADHPRQLERVPAGAKFDIEMIINIFEKDDEKKLLNLLRKGMDFLEADYLGGSGSRGYGQVKFNIDWDQLKSKSLTVEA